MSDEDNSRRAFLRGGFLRGFRRDESPVTPPAQPSPATSPRPPVATVDQRRRSAAADAIERALRRGAEDGSTRRWTGLRPEAAPKRYSPLRAGQHGRAPIPLIRPPGAVDEIDFLQRCEPGCTDCARACPVQAITAADPRMRAAAGTPVLEPAKVPCTGCPEYDEPPCITACPTGALDSRGSPRIGTAHVFAEGCLAHRHLVCTTCRERCPVPGAIVFRAGKPIVQEKLCVGCGQCGYACPAPGRAIDVLPLRSRPTPAPVAPSADLGAAAAEVVGEEP